MPSTLSVILDAMMPLTPGQTRCLVTRVCRNVLKVAGTPVPPACTHRCSCNPLPPRPVLAPLSISLQRPAHRLPAVVSSLARRTHEGVSRLKLAAQAPRGRFQQQHCRWRRIFTQHEYTLTLRTYVTKTERRKLGQCGWVVGAHTLHAGVTPLSSDCAAVVIGAASLWLRGRRRDCW